MGKKKLTATHAHAHTHTHTHTHTRDKPLELRAQPSWVHLICGCNTDLWNLGYCTAVKAKGNKPFKSVKAWSKKKGNDYPPCSAALLSSPSPFLSKQQVNHRNCHLPLLACPAPTAHHVTKHDFLPVWEGARWVMQSWCVDRSVKLLYLRICVSKEELQKTSIHPVHV